MIVERKAKGRKSYSISDIHFTFRFPFLSFKLRLEFLKFRWKCNSTVMFCQTEWIFLWRKCWRELFNEMNSWRCFVYMFLICAFYESFVRKKSFSVSFTSRTFKQVLKLAFKKQLWKKALKKLWKKLWKTLRKNFHQKLDESSKRRKFSITKTISLKSFFEKASLKKLL